jgi:hypothetical protein
MAVHLQKLPAGAGARAAARRMLTLCRSGATGLRAPASNRSQGCCGRAVVAGDSRALGVIVGSRFSVALLKSFSASIRVAPARASDSGGVGLGLAIAARAAALRGGRTKARSAIWRWADRRIAFSGRERQQTIMWLPPWGLSRRRNRGGYSA